MARESNESRTLEIVDVRRLIALRGTDTKGFFALTHDGLGVSIPCPVRVISGERRGPTLYLGAGMHGDEYSAMEVVRRALSRIDVGGLTGTVIGVPIQNVK